MLQQILGSINQIVYVVFGSLAVALIGKLTYDNYKLGKDEELIQTMKKTRELDNAKQTVDATSIDDLARKLDSEFDSDGDQ